MQSPLPSPHADGIREFVRDHPGTAANMVLCASGLCVLFLFWLSLSAELRKRQDKHNYAFVSASVVWVILTWFIWIALYAVRWHWQSDGIESSARRVCVAAIAMLASCTMLMGALDLARGRASEWPQRIGAFFVVCLIVGLSALLAYLLGLTVGGTQAKEQLISNLSVSLAVLAPVAFGVAHLLRYGMWRVFILCMSYAALQPVASAVVFALPSQAVWDVRCESGMTVDELKKAISDSRYYSFIAVRENDTASWECLASVSGRTCNLIQVARQTLTPTVRPPQCRVKLILASLRLSQHCRHLTSR